MKNIDENKFVYLFSTIFVGANDLDKFTEVLDLNGFHSPFKFIFENLNGINETTVFESLQEPSFLPDNICILLSKKDILPFKTVEEYFSSKTLNVFLCAANSNLETNISTSSLTKVAKANINFNEVNFHQEFYLNKNYELHLSPFIFTNGYDISSYVLPTVNFIIKFQTCDPTFLPQSNHHMKIFPISEQNLLTSKPDCKAKAIYKKKIIKCILKDIIGKSGLLYKSSDNKVNQDEHTFKKQLRELELRLLELEKELNAKSVENISLSQKCVKLTASLEEKKIELSHVKQEHYLKTLKAMFKNLKLTSPQKKHMGEIFKSFDKTSEYVYQNSNKDAEDENSIEDMLQMGIFEDDDHFIKFLKGCVNSERL